MCRVLALLMLSLLTSPVFATTTSIQFEKVRFDPPTGWKVHQHAKDQNLVIMSLTNGTDQAHMYARGETQIDMKKIFANGSETIRDYTDYSANGITWRTLITKKTNRDINKTTFVASFLTERDGKSYYGYSRGTTESAAITNATALMNATNNLT